MLLYDQVVNNSKEVEPSSVKARDRLRISQKRRRFRRTSFLDEPDQVIPEEEACPVTTVVAANGGDDDHGVVTAGVSM